MAPKQRKLLILGATLAFISVTLGAFGAHALKALLSEAGQQQYTLAIRYAFVHALGVMIIALALPLSMNPNRMKMAAYILTLGVLLFSGSLIIYALTTIKLFAMITPFGGLCFLLGWLMFIFSLRGDSQ